MKKLLFIGAIILFSLAGYSQTLIPGVVAGQVVASSFISDDFNSYPDGYVLTDSPNWVAAEGLPSPFIIDNPTGTAGTAEPNTISTYCAAYRNGTFSNDQFSQATMDGISGSFYCGVGVRWSSDSTGYAWGGRSTQSRFYRFINGTPVTLIYGDPFNNDDVIRLEVEGDTLQFFRNGVLDTSMSDDGIYVDDTPSKIPSGNPAVYGTGGGTETINDWSGGDL